LPWLGFALDVSYFEPEFKGQGGLLSAKVRTVPISPLVMLRVPLVASPPYPNGQLQLYAGAGPGFFWSETTARLAGAAERTSADTVEVGVDFRAGLSFEFAPGWALFGEYRFTYYTLSPEGRFDGQRAKVEVDLDTHHVIGGIGVRFR
jgi:opacity protein-like surface antigen